MQKVSYMGNGETTEFSFTFPYYENTNIIVTKNGAATTGYQIVGTSGGLDADIPYMGGKVVFETAPTALDSITIARSLPLSRTIDYQPTAKIDPTTVNQDMNYMMEVLKDLQDEFDTLATQYAEIANKESATALLAQITTIHNEIVAVDAQITALGDISTLRQTVTDLSTTVGGHTTSIGALDSRTTNISDYVIQSQMPSADNNYTWYRKYKSGWIEQGGYATTSGNTGAQITLPVTMSDAHYLINGTCDNNTTGGVFHFMIYENQTTTGFTASPAHDGEWRTGAFYWEVRGIAA
jgi:hypothetical protein